MAGINATRLSQGQFAVYLCEGYKGAEFRLFAVNDEILARAIIGDAYTKFYANRHMWTTPGAFAHNYLETAFKAAEDMLGKVAPNHPVGRMAHGQEVWVTWGRLCRTLAMGD